MANKTIWPIRSQHPKRQILIWLKAKLDWAKATHNVQRASMQDSQLLLKFTAKGNTMTNIPMSGVGTHLTTNIME